MLMSFWARLVCAQSGDLPAPTRQKQTWFIRSCDRDQQKGSSAEEKKRSQYQVGLNWDLIRSSWLAPMTRLPLASCLRPTAVITALSSPLVTLCPSDGCLRRRFLHSSIVCLGVCVCVCAYMHLCKPTKELFRGLFCEERLSKHNSALGTVNMLMHRSGAEGHFLLHCTVQPSPLPPFTV